MLLLTSNPLMVGTFLGGWEVVLILAVILILLGAKRLPEIGKGLGSGLSHFRKELDRQAHDAGESLDGIYGKPAAEALTSDNQAAELYDPAVFQDANANSHGRKKTWFCRWSAFLRLVWHDVFERLKDKR